MSESLTLQQLKDIKKLASQMGATTSIPEVNGSDVELEVPGSAVKGSISGNAESATYYTISSAPTWSSGSYAKDSIVQHNDKFYEANEETTDEPGDSDKWSETHTIQSALAGKVDNVGVIKVPLFYQIGDNAPYYWDLIGITQSSNHGWSVSLSANGKCLAIGSPDYDGYPLSGNGYVRIYERNEETLSSGWKENYNTLYGREDNHGFGWSVSLSEDGTVLVATGKNGVADIYEKETNGNSWFKKQYVSGTAKAVAVSADGKVVAVGKEDYNKVCIFRKRNDGTWSSNPNSEYPTNNGVDEYVEYERNDGFGASVSLNADGTRMAVGEPKYQNNKGRVLVYDTTVPTSHTIINGTGFVGEDSNDKFGLSVSLSYDGKSVAMGALPNYVQVHQEDENGNWSQLGSNIEGNLTSTDAFGHSVSLSADGTTVAIGSPYKDGTDTGAVDVFSYDSGTWENIANFHGDNYEEHMGMSVSLSADGTKVLAGGPGWNSDQGMVVMYNILTKPLDIEVDTAISAMDVADELETKMNETLSANGTQIQNLLQDNDLTCGRLEIKDYHSLISGTFRAWGLSYSNFGGSEINWALSYADQPYSKWGLKCKHGILAKSILIGHSAVTYSDARIKMNIEDVPDTLALDQVRQIPCRYYEYKDKLDRGAGKTVGFIAQEVKEVLPMAVKTTREFVPDHMRVAEVSWEEVDGKQLMIVSNLDADVTSGTKVRFAVCTGTPPELNEDGSVKTHASDDFSGCKKDVVMREDGKFEMDKAYDEVFIIGREVDDFLAIEKDKIFALHHSAIQELDKTEEAQMATIAALEQQNAAQQAAIDALMANIVALESQ